ncbi:MAG: aspartate-semialdehyde dehydrogenase [Gemmatimonadota bacterium]|jgi:aspartate-semialdehyde dehydrogenase|nr:aspartate-semialdehyde dehydrogenase [Gemmatimonadota bacterium]
MHVAILGATGAVGRTFLEVLEQRNFPVAELTLLASERSVGKVIEWRGRKITVRAPEPGCFRGVDVALFSAGGARSLEWAPRAAEEGAIVVDNSSAWRMDPEVPLVVPEVNPDAAANRPKGIIANPNCSTIQVVVALKALENASPLKNVVMTTFQSVSGAGETGKAALDRELRGETGDTPFSRTIAGNVIPQIGKFDGEGWTEEELKMVYEPRKILSLPKLDLAPTCVRVPVEIGHSVEMMVEQERPLSRDEAIEALSAMPGIVVSAAAEKFPTPLEVAGRDEVFVGRIRRDIHRPNVLHLWVVADNLRKGAATNAVQIAGLLG